MSKYENKFAKLQKKAAEFNFRNQLKVVKKKEFTLEEEEKEVRLIFIFLKQKFIELKTLTVYLKVMYILKDKSNWNTREKLRLVKRITSVLQLYPCI